MTAKAGLTNSDGCSAKAIEPAPRALDLEACEQRRDHQHDTNREYANRHTANGTAVEQRGCEQDAKRGSKKDSVAQYEMERIEPQLVGDWRTASQ